MKNKHIFTYLALIVAFSLTSCGGHERKIDTDSGNELLEQSIKKSNSKLNEISAGSTFSTNINGTINGFASIKIDMPSTFSSSQSTINNNLSINSSFEYRSNTNLDSIKNNALDNCESLFNTTGKYSYNDISFDGNYKEYKNGSNKTTVIKNNNEKEKILNSSVSENDINYNKYLTNTLLNIFSEKLYINLIFDEIDDENLDKFISKYDSFKQGNMTSSIFITYVDKYLYNEKMFQNSSLNREFLIKIIDNYQEFNVRNYFEFSKVTENEKTTLSTTFDYYSWKDNFNITIDKIIEELENDDSSVFNDESKNIIVNNLPNDIQFSFSLTFDKNYIINGCSFNLKTYGIINNIFKTSNTDSTLLNSSKITYDIDLSSNLNYLYSTEYIEI